MEFLPQELHLSIGTYKELQLDTIFHSSMSLPNYLVCEVVYGNQPGTRERGT